MYPIADPVTIPLWPQSSRLTDELIQQRQGGRNNFQHACVMNSLPEKVLKNTLAGRIDQISEANFYGRKISPNQRQQAARLIAGRLGLPGGYAGAFAESPAERSRVVRVFTGENLGRNARRRHVLAEEACRSLRLLGRMPAQVAVALKTADDRLLAQIAHVRERHPDTPRGTFCCPFCTVSVWRNAVAGGLRTFAPELAAGLRHLRSRRDAAGGWRVYPFFYTLSALLEIDLPAARAELRHAAPRCAHLLPMLRAQAPYADRRRELLRRVLAAV